MKNDSTKTTGHFMLVLVLALGFALLSLAILFAPRPDIKLSTTGGTSAQGTQTNTISVSGNAELTVSPDEAEVYVRIVTEKPTARTAQEENARLTNTVRDALKKKYDLDDDQIESDSYNLWPQQKYNPDTREYEKTGFRVQHLLKVTTDELDKIGDMLDTAVDNGANGIDRISFKLSKKLEADVRDQALGRAASSAREKADTLATTLGVRLGDIASISESNFNANRYDYAMPTAEMAMDGAGKSFNTEISPQDVSVTANLNVAYQIE